MLKKPNLDLSQLSKGYSEKSESAIPRQKAMDQLWEVMAATYGQKWKFPLDAQPTWADTLTGISPAMMGKGIKRMREKGLEWPPGAIEFRNLCLPTPDDYNVVSEEVGFQMAIGNRSDKAPEIVYTLREMGSEAFELKHEESWKAKKRWAEWYGKTLEDIAHGIELPEPELQIEKTEAKASPDSEAVISARTKLNTLFD